MVKKQNVVYTHSGILFSLKKEGNSDTCYNSELLYASYAADDHISIKLRILYDSNKIRLFE